MIETIPWNLADTELHERATKFCKNFLSDPFDPRNEGRVWLVQKQRHILAAGAMSLRPDICIFRSIDPEATVELAKRADAYMADQGLRGARCFFGLVR